MPIKKGKKYAYVPPMVELELTNIKQENDLESNAEAFRKMAKNSAFARMVKKNGKKPQFEGLKF